MINEKDLHYEYSSRGYMLYYKGEPIGGAGISKRARGHRGNVNMFRDLAKAEKQAILSGRGSKYMLANIKEIDEHDSNDHPGTGGNNC